MDKSGRTGRAGTWIQLRDRWIDAVLNNYRVVLLCGLLVTAVAVWLATQLRIDSDLRQLLPKGHPALESLERVEESFGALGSVNLVIESPDAEQRHAFAHAVAQGLKGDPLLTGVDFELPVEYFERHALYYLSDAEMEELRTRVTAWQHFELCSHQPNLCVEAPDPKALEKLKHFAQSKRDEAQARLGFGKYIENDKIGAQVVFIQPKGPSSDLAFATKVSEYLRERVGEIHQRAKGWEPDALRYNLVGPYVAKSDEQRSIRRDMLVSGAVGLGGVLVVLLILFRSWRALVSLLLPLFAGVAWSLGAAQLLLGHLNSMTSLIASVVMGLGVDAGIHFLSHTRRERLHYKRNEAIKRAFCRLIVPLLVASATTLGCFLVMATSGFPAFHEFGIIAAAGVFLCLLSMVSVFPALLAWVGVTPPTRRQAKRVMRVGPTGRLLSRHPGKVFVVVVLLSVAFAPALSIMEARGFEFNGRLLQSQSARDRTEADVFLIRDIFGKDIHAAALLFSDKERMTKVYRRAQELYRARKKRGESVVAELFAAPALLPDPSIDPIKRQAAIVALDKRIGPQIWGRLQGKASPEPQAAAVPVQGAEDELDMVEFEDVEVDLGEQAQPKSEPEMPVAKPESETKTLSPQEVARLRAMLTASPVHLDKLPPKALQRVHASNGTWAILAYPDFDAADIETSLRMMEEVRDYGEAEQEGVYVGESTVYASMYQLMRDEWPVILGLSALFIALVVYWQMRSLLVSLLTVLPLALSMLWLLGTMGYCGLKFSLFSVPVLPAILGIGVDNAIYLVSSLRGSAGKREAVAQAISETGTAIWAATATTSVGFASFLVADSGGLRSIGMVAVLGILIAALSAILVLPSLALLLGRRGRLSLG